MTLREVILSIVRPLVKPQQRSGKATNVRLDKCVCDVELAGGVVLYDVKLKSIEADASTGVVCVPKDKSAVVCSMMDGIEAQWVLTKVNELERWSVITEGGKVDVLKNGEVHLNGSNLGALAVLDKLVKAFNRLEQKHDGLAADFNAHVHANNGVAPTVPSQNIIASTTTAADLENKKVKQGDGS